MSVEHALLVGGLVTGVFVLVVFLLVYSLLASWWKSMYGRVIFTLSVLAAAMYTHWLMYLFHPEPYAHREGLSAALVVGLDTLMVLMLLGLVRAQRKNRE